MGLGSTWLLLLSTTPRGQSPSDGTSSWSAGGGTNIRTVLKHLEVVSGQCILANTCPYNGATLRIPNVAEGPANLPRTNRVDQQRTLREG